MDSKNVVNDELKSIFDNLDEIDGQDQRPRQLKRIARRVWTLIRTIKEDTFDIDLNLENELFDII